MIQISNEDAAFILDELKQRAQHQIVAYNTVFDDLQGVINDLESSLNAVLPVQETIEKAPKEAVAAFMDDVPHEQFDEDAEVAATEEPEAPSA